MHRPDNGFTLLELLISLTIVAVIVVLIFSALRIGTRAWEKGEANVEKRQRYRIVLNLMRQQLASVCLDGKKGDIFQGDDSFLEFISRRSLNPANSQGPVHVRYQKNADNDSVRVSVYEENLVFSDIFSDEPLDNGYRNPEDFHELIRDMADFGFEYLKEKEGRQKGETEKIWQASWEAGQEEGFPLAVKIRYKGEALNPPIFVIVPIRGGNPA